MMHLPNTNRVQYEIMYDYSKGKKKVGCVVLVSSSSHENKFIEYLFTFM